MWEQMQNSLHITRGWKSFTHDNLSNPVLADKLYCNVHALPCLGSLGDIITNLLGGLKYGW